MSDARSLLRQQRNARRIQHPHVQYTAPGKLSCTICHEPIKSEALWDNHTRSAGHRQRLLATAAAKGPRVSNDATESAATNGSHKGESKKNKPSSDTLSDEALLAQIIGGSGQKRKHDEDDEDMEMDDAADEGDETAPAKRSKPDLGSPTTAAPTSSLSTTTSTAANGSPAPPDSQQSDNKDTDKSSSSKRTSTAAGGGGGTPPGLVRRISGTPSHGVELQIPSRPATPSASATSTPKATPMGRSPLIPQEGQMAGLPSTTTKPPPRASFASASSSSTTAGKESTTITTTALTSGNEAVDDADDDWAAFESEVVHAAPAKSTASATTAAGYSGDAVIAAAPMTAQQLAEKQDQEERERRRAQVDVDLEDEKEEATRALETEFEEMEELEARVRKLKEKREAIRRGSVPAATNGPLEAAGAVAAVESPANGAADEKKAENENDDDDDDEDDDDDDDEEDDWAGFRFRA